MKDSGKIIIALLAGAAVGAAVGLLLAPDSGAELRSDISDYVNDLVGSVKDKAESTANNLREYGNSALEKGKEKFRSAVSDLNDYKDGVVDSVRSKASNAASQAKDYGQDLVDTAKSKIKGQADDLNSAVQNS